MHLICRELLRGGLFSIAGSAWICTVAAMRTILSLVVLITIAGTLTAQNADIKTITLNGLYNGPFPDVLEHISRDHGVKFNYNRQAIMKYNVRDAPDNRPLDEFLEYWCFLFDLNYIQKDDGVIYLVSKESFRKQQQAVEKAEETRKKNYSGPATAYGLSVSGKVIDKRTGESLPFTNVVIHGTRQGTYTNADGLFTLQDVPSDTSTLAFSYIGYGTEIVKLTPYANLHFMVVELQLYGRQLNELVVTAQREDALKTNETISTISMNPQSLSKLPNVGERDIMRAFQLMPGVSSSNESSSGLYVRGGTPDQNLILYDGFTIYHVDHLYGFFSAFNANAIKDVRLYKGGFESKFGGRLSSVMEITGKDGNANKFSAGGNAGLLSVNGYVEMPIGKLVTTLFAFRRSWKGPLYNKIFDLYNSSSANNNTVPTIGRGPGGGARPDFTTTVRSYFYDLNGKITFRPTEKDVVSFSVFNGTDDLDNSQELNGGGLPGRGGPFSFSSTTNDITTYGNTGLSLKWSRQWTSKLYMHLLASQSHYFSDRNRSTESSSTPGSQVAVAPGGATSSGAILENNNLNDRSAQMNVIYQAFSNLDISGGLFFANYDITYSYGTNDTTTIIDRQNEGTLAGGYLQGRLMLADRKLSIIPGIRLSSFDVTGGVYYEPRFSASYNFSDRIKVTAATGRYYQFANRVIREDILAGSRDFWILSDGNSVKVSHADHLIAGVSYETRSKLFGVEAYQKNYANLSEYTLRFESNFRSGTSYNENFYTGTGYARGVEFLAQQKTGRLKGWASYTLAQVQNKFDVYGGYWYPAAQDVRHEFKFVTLYNIGRWDFSATYVHATGRPYTAPLGGYQLTLIDGTTRDYVAVGSKNTMRLPYYQRMDASVTFELRNKNHEDIGNLGISVFNGLNRKNVWYKEFQVSEGTVVETDVSYLGITPNITLSLKI